MEENKIEVRRRKEGEEGQRSEMLEGREKGERAKYKEEEKRRMGKMQEGEEITEKRGM